MSLGARALRRAPLLLGLLLAASGGLAVHAHYDFPGIGIDDANITFVYARNLAAGEGLVFTPGFERVEGFSSAAWTALCALAFALHPAPERGLVALSLLLCAGALWLVLETALRLAAASAPAARERASAAALALTALWLSGLPRFYAWSTASLMESSLWSLLDAAAAWSLVGIALAETPAAQRRPLRALALAGVWLLVTRPESLALVPALLALAGVAALPACGSARAALRRLLPLAALFGASAILLTGARLAYFGFAFPNTYYAKVSPDRLWGMAQGWLYLRGYFEQTPAALVLCGAALALALGIGWRWLRGAEAPPSRAARAVLVVSLFVWVCLLLPLGGGGDHFSSFRFYQVAAPLFALPVAWLAARGLAEGPRRVARPALAFAALALLASAVSEWRAFAREDRLGFGFGQAEAGRRKAEALNRHFAPELRPSVGAIATGGLGFGYEGRVVDLMGLNWTAMAHSPGERKGARDHAAFDLDVFWSEPADLVAPDLTRQPPADACALYRPWELAVLQGLYLTPRFHEHYRAGSFETAAGHVSGFFRDAWLAKLPPASVRLLDGAPAECERRLQRALHVASRATARNALLIVVDTLGMKHVSLAPEGHTPQIARLARSSVFLANAQATAPWTQPSLASLLTGLLPAQHGVRVLGGILQEAQETLPELLEARGFETAAIVSHELLGTNYGFGQGFQHFDASHLGGHGAITSAQVSDAALRWLGERAPERPFFLMVHYFDPHYTYQHHPEHSLTDGYRGPLTPGIGIEKLLALRPELSREDIDYLIGLHREEAAFTDAAIGRLVAQLDASGLGRETLVVLTADHGEEFMERGWIGHTRTLYQELLHVPLLFRHPALPARRIEEPVSLLDVAPTLSELLGVAFPEQPGAGRSFARSLRNPKVPLGERDVFAEVTYLPRTPGNEEAERMRAVKTSLQRGSLKAIHDATSDRSELYDLASDPDETRNLHPEHPRAAELAARLASYEAVAGHASAAQIKSLVEEEARRLQELGYLH